MGQVLQRGLLQGREPVGGGRIMGAEAGVHNKLVEVWGFAESDRGRFDEEVQAGWIRGEDVETFSKDPFESVEAQIISSGEGKVMGVTGGAGGGAGELGIAVSGPRGQDSQGRRMPWLGCKCRCVGLRVESRCTASR